LSPLNVPIFPLNTVLFPGGLLPLRVFEARYMDMARDCLKRDAPFGVCLIREGNEVGAPAVPEAIGCLAKIIECDMQQQGILSVKTQGGQRFRILERRTGAQGLTSADIELIPAEAGAAVPAEFDACARLLEMVVADQGRTIFAEPHTYNDAAWVGYRLAEILPVPLAAKQKLLELSDSVARLSILQRYLEGQGLAKKPS
jgi:hypothetical protein